MILMKILNQKVQLLGSKGKQVHEERLNQTIKEFMTREKESSTTLDSGKNLQGVLEPLQSEEFPNSNSNLKKITFESQKGVWGKEPINSKKGGGQLFERHEVPNSNHDLIKNIVEEDYKKGEGNIIRSTHSPSRANNNIREGALKLRSRAGYSKNCCGEQL